MDKKDFFYSKALGLYISKGPLLVSRRVLKAAKEAGVKLLWDKEGRIIRTPFHDTKKLLEKLNSTMLSAKEYTTVLTEEKDNDNEEHLQSLKNEEFSEWLNSSYRIQNGITYVMDKPLEADTDTALEDLSPYPIAQMKIGRPGWFEYDGEKINAQGFPENISEEKDPAHSDDVWKYWSVSNTENPVATIRGFVLSSGTCSLDYDIPLFAKHAKLMIRECRVDFDGVKEPNEETLALFDLIEAYKQTLVIKPMERKAEQVEMFFHDFDFKNQTISNYLERGIVSDELQKRSIEESIADIRGKSYAYNGTQLNGPTDNGNRTQLTLQDLNDLLDTSSQKVIDAIANKEKIIFVAGHENPDADAIISSVFEALRRSVTYDEVCVPVILGDIPKEVTALLGEDLCNKFIKDTSDLYKEANESGLVRWTLVDWNEFENEQFVDSVIDHHIFEKPFPHYTAISKELNWASTLQVYAKILGNDIDLDQDLSSLLLAATLAEAEYTLMEDVMGDMDKMLYQDLVKKAECKDPKSLYIKTIQPLLAEEDSDILFKRDYKQSHEMMGFSVIKKSGLYDDKGICQDNILLEKLIKSAHENNLKMNLPLTVVKIVDYHHDGIDVNCEEIFPVFNENWRDHGFKDAVLDVLENAMNIYHKDHVDLIHGANSIKAINPKEQVPRLLLAPLLVPLVEEHSKFFYSNSLGKYVARGFFDGNEEAFLPANSDKKISKPKNYISYNDVKDIVLQSDNMSVMTLSEYWTVYDEATKVGDHNMVASLRDPKFVEMLDTYILNKSSLLNNPTKQQLENLSTAPFKDHEFLPAHPGLIRPLQIDAEGVPAKIESPDNYGDPNFWRYWAPDIDHSIACRGHIFLLNQTSIDLKIPPNEKHQNMGFRPVYDEISDMKYQVCKDNGWLSVQVQPRSFGIFPSPKKS